MSQIVLSSNVSGTAQFTIAAPGTNNDRTVTLPDATGVLVLDNAVQTLSNKTIQGGTITLATAQASTSGTSIDFTGVPSWVNRITIMFRGVSLSGSSYYLVQIGAGSFLTSGYESASGINAGGGTVDVQTSSNGFIIRNSAGPAAAVRGTMVLTRITGNTWVSSHSLGDRASVTTSQGGGDVALSGALDRVRITTVNGTDTFDAGTINISWE